MVPVICSFTFWVQTLNQITPPLIPACEKTAIMTVCVPEKEGCKGSTQSASGTAIWSTPAATPLSELQIHTAQDYIQLVSFPVQVSFRNWCLQRRPANLLPLGNIKPPLDTLALPHSCDMKDFNYLASCKHQITISCCLCYTCLASLATWSPLKPAVVAPGCARHEMTLSGAFQYDLYFGAETPSQECSSPADFSNQKKKKKNPPKSHQKSNISLADRLCRRRTFYKAMFLYAENITTSNYAGAISEHHQKDQNKHNNYF